MRFQHIAIVTATGKGLPVAERVKTVLDKESLETVLFAPERYGQDVSTLRSGLSPFFAENFRKFDSFVLIMSLGIAVRSIAPVLKSKYEDPAVVLVDLNGRYVISVLSAHVGGANELTRVLARGLKATPIITTASEVLMRPSVEAIAEKLHCTIHYPQNLSKINAALLDKPADLFIPSSLHVPAFKPKGIVKLHRIRRLEKLRGRLAKDSVSILVSERLPSQDLKLPCTVILFPKKIAVGIGTRREISKTAVSNAVRSALKHIKLPRGYRFILATGNVKRGEKGIINASKELGANLKFIGMKTLSSFQHKDLALPSKLVIREIGVGGICEPAALIAAERGSRLIMRKKVFNGKIALAVAEGP